VLIFGQGSRPLFSTGIIDQIDLLAAYLAENGFSSPFLNGDYRSQLSNLSSVIMLMGSRPLFSTGIIDLTSKSYKLIFAISSRPLFSTGIIDHKLSCFGTNSFNVFSSPFLNGDYRSYRRIARFRILVLVLVPFSQRGL